MHAIEERSVPPYLFGDPILYQVTLGDGNKLSMVVRRHHFQGWLQRYDRLAPLLTRPALVTGPIQQATAHLVNVRKMWESALVALRSDPLFFVERMLGQTP